MLSTFNIRFSIGCKSNLLDKKTKINTRKYLFVCMSDVDGKRIGK